MSAVIRNRFYSAVALALAALVFVGFARTFYFRAWFDVPPTTMLLILHGIAFTACLQPRPMFGMPGHHAHACAPNK